jgi:hypothetical protein
MDFLENQFFLNNIRQITLHSNSFKPMHSVIFSTLYKPFRFLNLFCLYENIKALCTEEMLFLFIFELF